jgi:diguanylate cyclase (GGDEF)-like protein
MKRFQPIHLLLLCALLLPSGARAAHLTGRVAEVEDAVTLQVTTADQQRLIVHLMGVGAPPATQADGKRALQATRALVQGETVGLETDAADPSRARVILPNGRSLAQELVKGGYAWRDRNQPDDEQLSAFEADARQAGRGLWAADAPPAGAAHAPAASEGAQSESAGETSLAFDVVCAIALILALAVVVLSRLVWRLRRSAGLPVEKPGTTVAREIKTHAAHSAAAKDAATAAGAAEALESSRHIIQDLLSNLNEFVGALIERNNTHATKMEGYKVSIQQAMTMAGLEQIERLLVQEIADMQAVNARYRADLEQANARLKEQETVLDNMQSDAKTDFLTHLANRRALDERVAAELARAQRYGNMFSLILFDIDHFKRVNDAHGHLVGDRVLQVVAHVLEITVRQTDVAGRFGGEEFMVILPETKLPRARLVAEKIRSAVESAGLKHEQTTVRVTVSAGVGEVAAQGDTQESLIARTDAALYRAKQSGRNRIEIAETPPPVAADAG